MDQRSDSSVAASAGCGPRGSGSGSGTERGAGAGRGSAAEAATHLGVSVGTAKNRRHEIYEKLGVHDLGAACAIAAPELTLDQAS